MYREHTLHAYKLLYLMLTSSCFFSPLVYLLKQRTELNDTTLCGSGLSHDPLLQAEILSNLVEES